MIKFRGQFCGLDCRVHGAFSGRDVLGVGQRHTSARVAGIVPLVDEGRGDSCFELAFSDRVANREGFCTLGTLRRKLQFNAH